MIGFETPRDRVRVVVDEQVMSGEPCIEGTRVPVETVLLNLRAGHSAESIYSAYPTLPRGAIEAAIDWAEERDSQEDGVSEAEAKGRIR